MSLLGSKLSSQIQCGLVFGALKHFLCVGQELVCNGFGVHLISTLLNLRPHRLDFGHIHIRRLALLSLI